MKHFHVIEGGKPKRGRYPYRIYQIKRGELVYITHGSIFWGSTRGLESEAMNKLIEEGLLPKKYAGYYLYTNSAFRIGTTSTRCF